MLGANSTKEQPEEQTLVLLADSVVEFRVVIVFGDILIVVGPESLILNLIQ